MATAAGAPTISGTPMVGQTLTADPSGITDADGLSTPGWTYQWVRVSADLTENDISGATSQTYKLVTGDVGHKIKVVVSFTDDASESESRPSEPFPEHKFVVEQSDLVSNRDQGSRTHLGNGLSAIRAQGFRTGPHPHRIRHLDSSPEIRRRQFASQPFLTHHLLVQRHGYRWGSTGYPRG